MGMIFVRKSIHLSAKIFVSTNFNHSTAGLFISYKSVMDTLEVLLFALLFQLVGDVVCLVSWLLPVTVPVRSRFLYIVVRNGKEIHCVLNEFLILRSSITQEVPARCQCPTMINIHCTAFWVPSRAIHTIRCFQHPQSFVLILD